MDYSDLIAECESDLVRATTEEKQIESKLANIRQEKAQIQAALNYARLKSGVPAKLPKDPFNKTSIVKRPRDLPKPTEIPPENVGTTYARTLVEMMLLAMQKEPAKEFSVRAIMLATGIDDQKYVRSTLARLYREGRIEKLARGWYRISKIQGAKSQESNDAVIN
jgi:hypothetical protein